MTIPADPVTWAGTEMRSHLRQPGESIGIQTPVTLIGGKNHLLSARYVVAYAVS